MIVILIVVVMPVHALFTESGTIFDGKMSLSLP